MFWSRQAQSANAASSGRPGESASERALSIRELLNSSGSSDENDAEEARQAGWGNGSQAVFSPLQPVLSPPQSLLSPGPQPLLSPPSQPALSPAQAALAHMQPMLSSPPHSAAGMAGSRGEDEFAAAAKPRHAGAHYGAGVGPHAHGADRQAGTHSPAYGGHYPQAAANPSKMRTPAQIPGGGRAHDGRRAHQGSRPGFGHSHSAQVLGAGGYGAARPAQLVARTSGDIAAAGEMRYRPYPEIVAGGAGGAAGARPQLARAVSEAVGAGAAAAAGRRAAEAQKRRRRTQACEYCHLKKVKCEGDGARCINCIKNDVQCVWGQKRKRGPKPKAGQGLGLRTQKIQASRVAQALGEGGGSNGSGSGGGGGDDDVDSAADEGGEAEALAPAPQGIRMPKLDREMSDFFSDKVPADTREAVRFYFDYFYPLSPMFHPSMFIRRVVHGQVDPLLLDAMKATTARVITQKTGRFVDGRALARSVKARILGQLEQPTVDLLRTIVVVTLLAGSQGEYVSYNSLICLAASLVVRMGWHKLDLYRRPAPTSWDEWVALEVKRRLFWLVYQIDSYQAMLTGRPMSIAEDSVYVSAPCSDYEWDAMHISRRMVPSAQPEVQRPRSHQRSSRSSSGSTSSLVQSLRVNAHEIVATGAFSYSFMALCELTAVIAQINSFLCDAKASRPMLGAPRGLGAPFPAVDFMGPAAEGALVHPVLRTARLPSEYPAFGELDERLEEWKRNLLAPEDLRDDSADPGDISYFGTADHRRFMMRVRYFCLHCYYVPITIVLHQANRPSFFTEYEQPLAMRLARRAASEPASDDVPVDASVTSEDISAMESDRALREMLNAAFADTWNEGILAYDVEAGSWRVCVQAALGLSEHLQRNSDFPLERFDQVIPFCIFMSVSVLIRQVRICSRRLVAAANGDLIARDALEAAGGYAAVADERSQCVRYIKHQWSILQNLGALWDVDGMKMLLKSMQVDEVANAADLFSGMSL